MGRSQSTWLGFLTFLPLLSATQQPAPESEQTSSEHMFQHTALGSVFTQSVATQPAVPQPRTPPTAAPASFEVSTVKLNKSGSGSSGSNFTNGRFTATNIQLKNLMEYSAYGIAQPRILGGPKWLDSERFDIEAKMESAAAARLKALSRDQRRAEMQAMFQNLLADRFKLAVHWEMRELPVYALVGRCCMHAAPCSRIARTCCRLYGRLQRGTSLSEAQAEMNSLRNSSAFCMSPTPKASSPGPFRSFPALLSGVRSTVD